MAKKSVKKEEKKSLSPEEQANAFFKNRKEEHYNFEESVEYEVSQGSLTLDLHVGKLTSGVVRHVGVSRGGKTSQFLEDVKQFLKAVPNSRAVWVLAEGRLSKEMKKRSGLEFVYHPSDWKDGQVLVVESNVFDFVFDFIRDLIGNNPLKKRYFFVVDSTNGLKTKEDLDKPTSGAMKVAGGATITSDFLSRVTLAMTKFGHILGLIGQIRASPKINQYEKQDPKLSNATGGNAQDHYPNIFLEFEPRYKADIIGDPNNPLGHWAKAKVIKTDKEKTVSVKYPIKYNSNGDGGSIWREYEVADLMIQWGFLMKSGAWLKMNEDQAKELHEKGLIESEEFTIQGIDKLREWLEENPAITDFYYQKFENLLK
jgi:hypothetical protein